MASFHNKVIAVSGAGSGIGLATAKYLYNQGARVSITDIKEEILQRAVVKITDGEDNSERILTTVADVRVSKQVNAWIEKTVSHFGTLDSAINVAGVVGKNIGIHTTAQLSDEEWSFIMDVNINGVFYALRSQVQAMQKLGKGGSIVNVSSVAGMQGNSKNAAYSASKHAVIGLTRSAAKEFGDIGIRLNAIAPGAIETPMTQNIPESMKPEVETMLNNQAIRRFAEPEEIGKSIAFLLGNDSSYVTGAVLVADGGKLC